MDESPLLAQLWLALDGPASALQAVRFEGRGSLPSVYAVTELAAAQVAAATLAVAELHAARTAEPIRAVTVDRGHAAAAFRSERYQRPLGWSVSAVWDPIAGDYPTRDGWIRLHTNYSYHRDAVLRVLGVANDRAEVARAVLEHDADALETAVVLAGGCAAAMRTQAEWRAHAQGVAVAREPLVAVDRALAPRLALPDSHPHGKPLGGVRVLDLTRVIAGPVCTRVLAAYGADVMRIDPPGFEEVPALLGDTTSGKRRVALDLRRPEDRVVFEGLVASAHVLVSGYRGDALERLDYGPAALRALNANLVIASLDAYGWTGPWRGRRGFDSLVQMTCGIAARGMDVKHASAPFPLPAQALDHGTGYLLAAATCRALTHALQAGGASSVRCSLARTAQWLMDLGETGALDAPDFSPEEAAPWLERADTAWGPMQRVTCPGRIEGIAASWSRPAGPLGSDAPAW